MTEPEHPDRPDQAELAETEVRWAAKDTEPIGDDQETIDDAANQSPQDDTEGPSEALVTLEYVPEEGDQQEPTEGRRKPSDVPGYEVLGELGRGAMGVVYRARQKGLKRLVALKMVLAGSHASPQQLARFQTEAEAVAQIVHPNIVQIHEVGEHDGVPYFSLEYVDGQSLDTKLGRKPLEAAEAARLTETLARTMHHAHEQGIVHRDLKPGNVLLTADGTPKISDFGLAKRLEQDSGQTKTGTIMGTPSYMAPEQAKGEIKEIGPLADVYALGAILYEMLTGRPPFAAANPVDTVMQVINDEPVPPTRLQPKLPRDLETICLKCLQKDSRKRYTDSEELAKDLHRFSVGKPIQARPVGAVERVWRWCCRNPRIAGLSATAAILAVTLMIGGPVAAMVIYDQKKIADEARLEAVDNERQANLAKERAIAAEGDAIAARDDAVRNEKKAVEAWKVAAAQGRAALDTLRSVIEEVQGELENRPQQQTLRQKLVKTALGGLDNVANDGVDVDQKDLLMAAACRRLGDIYMELGDGDRAIEQYHLCHNIVEDLNEKGTLQNAHHNLSHSLSNMGEAARRAGKPSKAKEYYLQALEIRREWAEVQPSNKFIPQNIAETLGRLGNVSLMLGQLKEGHEYFLESHQLRQQWHDSDPANFEARQELAGARNAIARMSLRLGKLNDAERFAQQALEMFVQLCDERPGIRTTRWNFAQFAKQLGTVHLMAGKPEEAVEDYAQALPILEELSEGDPENALLRRHLAEAHYGIATAYLRLNNPAATDHYETCLDLRRRLADNDPASHAEQIGLMLSLGRCGRHQEAAKIAEPLQESTDSHVLYLLATGYAVCAASVQQADAADSETAQLDERYGQLAVEMLRSAIDQGYQDSAEIQLDPDLDGIRQRTDFQELLQTSTASEAAASEAT